MTDGDGAIGIIAQSLGGGGGYADGVFGNGGGTGNAGDRGRSQWLDLHNGDGSHGALLQSIGGGNGGDVDYTQVGDILAIGDNSIGLRPKPRWRREPR